MLYQQTPFQPQIVFDQETWQNLESQIDELNAEFRVREIEVTFNKDAYFFGQIGSSNDVYQFLKERILKGIEIQEHFIALYLNNANKIIGYYHHSTGTINATMVDIEIVAAVALKTLAKSVIISHNHPSGNTKPSDADRSLTRKLKEALQLFDIRLLDHLIVTNQGYFSFAESGDRALSGMDASESELESKLRQEILLQLKRVTSANSPQLFEMIQTPQGYAAAEKMIIHKVIHDQMIPAAVIPILESEMSML